MKKMTLWLGSIALVAAAAAANAQDMRAAPTQNLATSTSTAPQEAVAPGGSQGVAATEAPVPLAATDGDASVTGAGAGAPQYYSRAQVGDEPAQTTAAADSADDSYGASMYGSSAAGRRETASAMLRAGDKP